MSQSLLDLELDLDAFSGPFDLLLGLVLRDELELVEVPVAEIVLRYLERLADDPAIDLESVSEFLVLVAALCELKARLLVGDPEDELEDLDAETAAEELAERLAEYRRFKTLAGWLAARRAGLGRRVFRSGPPPLAPRRPAAEQPPGDPATLGAAIARLLEPPAVLDTSRVRGRRVPVRPFLERFRRLLAEQGTFLFDDEVRVLARDEQAAAFLALLELYKCGEVRVGQAELFAPIRVARSVRRLRRADTPAASLPGRREEAVA